MPSTSTSTSSDNRSVRHCTDSVVAWWLSVAGADEFAAADDERCDNVRYNGKCCSGPDYADSQRSASDDDGVRDNDNVVWEHDDPYDDKHHNNDDDHGASNDHDHSASNDHHDNRWEHRWHRSTEIPEPRGTRVTHDRDRCDWDVEGHVSGSADAVRSSGFVLSHTRNVEGCPLPQPERTSFADREMMRTCPRACEWCARPGKTYGR